MNMTKILALDTATFNATVAVCEGETLLAELDERVTTHSEGLISLIEATLRQANVALSELDAIACGCGPGSFTGVRIGLSTAKGLCFATGIPLVTVSSLRALAFCVSVSSNDEQIVSVIDARHREVFWGQYRHDRTEHLERVSPPELLCAELRDHPQPLLMIGDGFLLYQDLFRRELPSAKEAPSHRLRAYAVAQTALERVRRRDFDDLDHAVPRYLREAEVWQPAVPQNAVESSDL